MRIASVLIVVTLACFSSHLWAQPAMANAKENREVLRMGLYPPDILMKQQQRLGITNKQRKEIAALVRAFQSKVTELQWSMPNEQQKLRELLTDYPVDDKAALAQAETVLDMESRFKQAHFELLIALKNVLTEGQVSMLDAAISARMRQAE